jgi:hypothetical protein
MKRRLSALSTPFWKFIFPAFWIVPLIINLILDIGRLLNIYARTRAPLTWRAIGGYLFLLLGSVILYKVLGVLKRVDADANYLYVSNYLKGIKIPLSDVEFVDKPESSSHQRIKIFLRSPSEFSEVIVFMPPFFAGREIVEELRNQLGGMRDRRDDSPLGNAELLHLRANPRSG